MLMVPHDPADRALAIECFLEDWRAGRADPRDADGIRAQLRLIGDVARLEWIARLIGEAGQA